MTFNAGFDRAIDTILEFYTENFDQGYQFEGAETLFEDFAQDVSTVDHINAISVYTYDSDSEELKKGIQTALNHLKTAIKNYGSEEPSGTISMRWKD